MSTDTLVEPDAEDYEESEQTSQIEAQAVSGDYVEPEKSQDPEVDK